MSTQSIPRRRRRLGDPTRLAGGAPSLESLGKCSEYLRQRKLKRPFCKVRLSVPFPELALRERSTERGRRAELPEHAPSPRSAGQLWPRQLAGPWKPRRRDPRSLCGVTRASRRASGGHDLTGAACELRKLPEPHLAGPGQRLPTGTWRNLKKGKDRPTLESSCVSKSANAMIACAKGLSPHWVAFSLPRIRGPPSY